MKDLFKKGDNKTYSKTVTEADIAAFHGEVVHPVCSTFALAREMEYSSRLFVLEMKDENEEGIGTFLTIDHQGPAFIGDELDLLATVKELNGNEIICTIEVKVGDRLVATGETGQKVLLKEKLERYFATLRKHE
ncbi:MAG: thioesterase family protein [Candidatus Cyclobacteriaceae bacterium M2_1C_046]